MTPCVRTEVVDGTAFTYVNGVRGTLNAEDARVLVERACTLPRGARYAETGSYLGCSALLIALHAPAATVWAHDLWVRDWSELPTASEPPPSSSDYFFKFYGAVRANGLENRVIPVRGESAWTLGIHAAQSLDLAFLDGDHSRAGLLADLEAVWPKLRPGAEMLVHDCVPGSGAEDAVRTFCAVRNVDVRAIPGTWGMLTVRAPL